MPEINGKVVTWEDGTRLPTFDGIEMAFEGLYGLLAACPEWDIQRRARLGEAGNRLRSVWREVCDRAGII